MQASDIADQLGNLSLSGKHITLLQTDDRSPNNVTAVANTPEEMHRLLVTRFGSSELSAILQDPDVRNVRRDANSMPDWFHVAELVEKYWRHEYRTPIMCEVLWKARFHNKPKRQADIRMWQMVGLSPQGWAAALGVKGESSKRYLFFRNVHNEDDGGVWVQAPGFKALPGGHNPACTNIDGSTVSMAFPVSRIKADGTGAIDTQVLIFDVARPNDDAIVIPAPDDAPRVVDVTANDRRVLLVHEEGSLTVIHHKTNVTYAFAPMCPAPPSPPIASTSVNPITGEQLETPEETKPEWIRHRVALATHDQCDPDTIALSTREGWVARITLPPPETPAPAALQKIADTMEFIQMGVDSKLGDPYKHPPQEPATSLCSRCVPGGDATVVQCGWHITYRNNSADGCPFSARYPAYQAFDCGPMNCVALLGTTLAVHTRNNKLFIASMVPCVEDPTREPVRFRTGTHGQDSPIKAAPAPYPSLSITMRHIFWLLPDGTLMVSTPATEQEHTAALRQTRK